MMIGKPSCTLLIDHSRMDFSEEDFRVIREVYSVENGRMIDLHGD